MLNIKLKDLNDKITKLNKDNISIEEDIINIKNFNIDFPNLNYEKYSQENTSSKHDYEMLEHFYKTYRNYTN